MKQFDFMNTTLILGFFDGIHAGHRAVISSAVEFAKSNHSKVIVLTFSSSPAEYFNNKVNYIYPREYNYQILTNLGVESVVETDFSSLVYISAEDYLKDIVNIYSPIGIFTGFNYTFGYERTGSPKFLQVNQNKYGYKYFCIEPIKDEEGIISSTRIKKILSDGNAEQAAILLQQPFILESKVIQGIQLGRKLGFPTANMKYPNNIVQLPYGVYKVRLLNKTGVLNWGIKPTVSVQEPILEVHIPDFDGDLYDKNLRVQILKKIRDEKKFDSLESLKSQISKDITECLK